MIPILPAIALGLTTHGTVQGHLLYNGAIDFKAYQVRVSTRPASPKPGHMGNFMIRMVGAYPIDSHGNFKFSLDPGVYNVDLYYNPQKGMFLAKAHEVATVKAGKTTSVTLSLINSKKHSKGIGERMRTSG